MSGSTITAFGYIPENSFATPGLFNRIFSTLSDNIGTLNEVIVNPAVVSGSTWASIGLVANSNNSDYIRFVDSANQRSTYRLGSNAGGTADGLNIWDESGNTMIVSFSKQSVRFFQNIVGPVFDTGGALSDTLNAATFGTGADSDESRIQSAIDAAGQQGVSRVYVPSSMLPYSASSISFIYPVQMIREGGNASEWDALAYGAAANNIQDDAPALAVLARVASTQSVPVRLPAGTYRCASWLSYVDVPIMEGVPDLTILKPDSGVSSPFFTHNVLNASRSRVIGVRIDGSNTTGKTGVYVGTGPIQTLLSWKDFYISGFSGAGGKGMRIGNVVQCNLEDGYILRSYVDLEINPSNAAFPTCVNILRTSIREAATDGLVIKNGTLITVESGVIESNASRGAYVAPGAGQNATVVKFKNVWWEGNQGGFALSSSSRTNSYALEVDGTAGTAQVSLEGGYFNIGPTSERAAHFTSNTNYVVDDVRMGAAQIPGAFVLDGAAGAGTFVNWPLSPNGLFGTVVKDTNNQVNTPYLAPLGSSLFFAVDAASDIGASAASRPRDIWMSRNLTVGGPTNLAFLLPGTVSGANQAGALLTGTPNTTINPDAAGLTGKKFVVAYYNQAGFQSAISVANVASGFGTLQLMSDGGTVEMLAARTSIRTLATSAVTVSAANTNVQANEMVFTIGGASGASLCISSGGTTYIFSSSLSAKNT